MTKKETSKETSLQKNLWGGRFQAVPDANVQAFGASLPVDQRLWREDITGSKAHARMLATVGVITAADAEAIINGLESIAQRIGAGDFVFDIRDEDIHMSIERALIEEIGEAGKRLHTARSRNDQVALDTRLYMKRRTTELMQRLMELRQVLLDVASAHKTIIMPGYTHLQKAQPLLFAHHLLSYYWMFSRDWQRMLAAHWAANVSPLGACALAGTSYPLDRQQTARELGFVDADGTASVIPNSMDAVSDRDYLLDALYTCSTTMMHLSRLSEELVLWSSDEFGFITLDDRYATGSSIMPQKKNPDFAELIRGKTGRVYGDLVGLLTVLKGLPLAYNKDLQEDKEGAFDAMDTLGLSLQIMSGMISTLQVNSQRMGAGA
ncbi:MAG: argininosuccinate lyase, partial [Coriobacteriales bacterium]|nr:argininosuccinate lyase [Coriobacteriales bacterium]